MSILFVPENILFQFKTLNEKEQYKVIDKMIEHMKETHITNINNPLNIMKVIADNIYIKEQKINMWKNTLLDSLDKLKNDCVGKAGELFIEKICNDCNIENKYNQDINSKDGTYDILIKNKKIEIKTSKMGKSRTFQHESLRVNGYDYILFLDICPEYLYITILEKFDLQKKSEILGIKAHLRKGASDIYKLDFTEKILHKLVLSKYSICVSNDTSLEYIKEFINNIIL